MKRPFSITILAILALLVTMLFPASTILAALGTTVRASVSSAGVQADDMSGRASISDDGRFITFESAATNLVPDDTNMASDIFVYDRQTGTTDRPALPSGSASAALASYNGPKNLHSK
jgi:hypothetical protein